MGAIALTRSIVTYLQRCTSMILQACSILLQRLTLRSVIDPERIPVYDFNHRIKFIDPLVAGSITRMNREANKEKLKQNHTPRKKYHPLLLRSLVNVVLVQAFDSSA